MKSPTNKSDNATKPSALSPSCKKCVNVLQQLISGLQSETKDANESPPLTLLKAIARADPKSLRVENTRDGVVMHIPVKENQPGLLRRWTKFVGDSGNVGLNAPLRALATSASPDSSADSTAPTNPLTIELKCRKCSTQGPEVSCNMTQFHACG